MGKIEDAQVLPLGNFLQGQLAIVVVVHVFGDSAQSAGQDFVALFLGLVYKLSVFHEEVLKVRLQAPDEVVGTFYDFLARSRIFWRTSIIILARVLRRTSKLSSMSSSMSVTKKVVLQVLIVSGKVAQIKLHHHDDIVFPLNLTEAVYLPVV